MTRLGFVAVSEKMWRAVRRAQSPVFLVLDAIAENTARDMLLYSRRRVAIDPLAAVRDYVRQIEANA